MTLRGFELWNQGLAFDRSSFIQESKSKFEEAGKAFFDEASARRVAVSRALYEYSTLMDALASVQQGRWLKSKMDFEKSLSSFAKASEILRATVHFGYLAPYVSGCASLETATEMEDGDERFQGFKNALALFEQSKLALGFRDDRHPTLHSIDILIKFTISRALLAESLLLNQKGEVSGSDKKLAQSKNIEKEFEKMAAHKDTPMSSRFRIDYFLKGFECERAREGPFITTFPERTTLWIGNIGIHSARIESLGGFAFDSLLAPYESLSWIIPPEFRGKLRIKYKDDESNVSYEEGCLTAI